MIEASGPRLKITYATLRNDNEQLHASYDAGLAIARGELGKTHGLFIDGRWRPAGETFDKLSPIDGSLVGRFAKGTREDVREAIAAARAAAPGWAHTPWPDRVTIMRRMADLISERQMELAALMGIEVGKNRLEALGDVEETADLIRYYCDQFVANDGFDHAMGNLGDNAVHTRSVLKPHGVWAIISPFNFPMALSGGPAGGALVAGNSVVYKPSSDAPLCGIKLAEVAEAAGLPPGVFNLVSGPGATVGAELQENPGIDGLLFTGSFEIGFNSVFRTFSKRFPQPVVVEMGGKNPAIVSACADIEEAAEGIVRSAFGFGGQKCSACSRVYVQEPVYAALLEHLEKKTRAIVIGDPTQRKVWLGPLVNPKAVAKYDAAVAEARRDGRIVVRRREAGRPRHGPLRGPHDRGGSTGRPPHLARRAVRAAGGGGFGQDAGRSLRAGQRHDLRPDGRFLQRRPGRGRALQGVDRGRRDLHQPPRRRDDGSVAGRPAVRWLEGFGHHRQGFWRPVLRPAVHARAVADPGRLTMARGEAAVRPTIRAAEPSDVAALAELAGELGYPTEPAAMADRLADLPAGDEILVALQDGVIVGWAHCAIHRSLVMEPHAEVLGLVVGEPMRGLGIGRHLMAAAEDWARAHQVPFIRLRSSAHRDGAHAFYLGLGYREQKRQVVFIRDLDLPRSGSSH